MEKPNIFRLATKELSQDGFFTWLLQWADSRNTEANGALNEIAQDFVRFLIGKDKDYPVVNIDADRQWHNIDIWAEVNDEFFIAIEDKTNTGEHSEQLERYKQVALNHYQGKNYTLVFIYLKTGNESNSRLKKIEEKGYKVVDRRAILKILTSKLVANNIFNDFVDYLSTIERQTNSHITFKQIISDWKAAEGFYLRLQELIPTWSDWGSVSNQMGGFLGFWYHWNWTNEIGEVYIQIENAFENGIKLVIKVSDWEPDTGMLYKLLNEVGPIAKKYDLRITKPDRYRAGNTSTLAVVQEAFTQEKNGDLNIAAFLETLKKLESIVDEFCEKRRTLENEKD